MAGLSQTRIGSDGLAARRGHRVVVGVVQGASHPQTHQHDAFAHNVVEIVQAELLKAGNLAKLGRELGIERSQLWLFQKSGLGLSLTSFAKVAAARSDDSDLTELCSAFIRQWAT